VSWELQGGEGVDITPAETDSLFDYGEVKLKAQVDPHDFLILTLWKVSLLLLPHGRALRQGIGLLAYGNAPKVKSPIGREIFTAIPLINIGGRTLLQREPSRDCQTLLKKK